MLYEPNIRALHHESKSLDLAFEATARDATYEHAASLMRARWGARLERDPWYNPHYARFGKPFAFLSGWVRVVLGLERSGRLLIEVRSETASQFRFCVRSEC